MSIPGPWQKAKRRWLKLLVFLIVVSLMAAVAVPLWLGTTLMWSLVHSPCTGGEQTPDDYGYVWEDVSLPARAGGKFRGYLIPGTNGATVIIPPTGSDGRDNQLPRAALLRQHGYTVFTFESRRCANQGPLSLGYEEVNEVADVLDYLRSRPDLDPERIGIWGFSTAGATSIMATARLPALRAVIAEGGYGDFLETGLSAPSPDEGIFVRLFLTLYRWSAMLTYRLVAGHDISVLSPANVIDEIAPRPVLLIYGSREVSLPGGYQQKAAAGENAELWVLQGAGHGNYREITPEEYEARIVSFFEMALKGEANR